MMPKKDGKIASLHVINDADDIKEGNMNQVFDRFYRSDVARGSEVEGSGSGLSIAKEIVSSNKLRIRAFGLKGSKFCLEVVF